MPQILRVENLRKTYGHGDIFRNVNFTLGPSETLGLFGMSGSGKSTLGRCILGLERLSCGTVFFEGKDLSKLRGKALQDIRPKMQMLFQHPEVSLNPRMQLIESVTEPLCYHTHRGKRDVFRQLHPLIKAVGLREEQFSCYPNQLSGGEIQRAMMVKIYSLSPKLIIADEPTSMLDMSVQAQILALMKKLQQENGTAGIFISHDPEVMLAMCDRIGILGREGFSVMEREAFTEYAGL